MKLTLRAGIVRLLDQKNVSRSDRRKVDAALRTLEGVLGHLDYLQATGDCQLAQKVAVPGDKGVWVVIGEWGDGSFDIVREEGSLCTDSLVGWRPGQTLAEYRAELHSLQSETPDAPRKRTVPLFRSASAKK